MPLTPDEERLWEACMEDFHSPDERAPRIPVKEIPGNAADLIYAIEDAMALRRITQSEYEQGMKLVGRLLASQDPLAEIAELPLSEDFDGTSILLSQEEPRDGEA